MCTDEPTEAAPGQGGPRTTLPNFFFFIYNNLKFFICLSFK